MLYGDINIPLKFSILEAEYHSPFKLHTEQLGINLMWMWGFGYF